MEIYLVLSLAQHTAVDVIKSSQNKTQELRDL